MPKYYFVYYECETRLFTGENLMGALVKTINEQDVIDIHPLQFQIDCNNKYSKWKKQELGETREKYRVISWQDLTVEEYRKFEGRLA